MLGRRRSRVRWSPTAERYEGQSRCPGDVCPRLSMLTPFIPLGRLRVKTLLRWRSRAHAAKMTAGMLPNQPTWSPKKAYKTFGKSTFLLLEPSWGVPGRLGRVPGRPCPVPGRPCPVPGRLVPVPGRLGSVLGRLGCVLGASWALLGGS